MRFIIQSILGAAALSSCVAASVQPDFEAQINAKKDPRFDSPGFNVHERILRARAPAGPTATTATPSPTPTGPSGACRFIEPGYNPSPAMRLYLQQAADLLKELGIILEVDPEQLTGGYLAGIFQQLARTVIRIDGLRLLARELLKDRTVSAEGEMTPDRIAERARDLYCANTAPATPFQGPDGNPLPPQQLDNIEAPPTVVEVFQKAGLPVPQPPTEMSKASGNRHAKIAAREVEIREAAPQTAEEKEKTSDARPVSVASLGAVLLAAVALF